MTAQSQDFEVFAGNANGVVFTVVGDDDLPLDISQAQDIVFEARRDLASSPVLTKKKSVAAGITFVTDGTDGKFQVNFAPADTAALTANYYFAASLVDFTSQPATVSTGMMQVGAAPAWTYSGDPTSSQKDAVRFIMGDTFRKDPLVFDGEILFALTQSTSTYGAAAIVCRSLASRFAREADTVDKDLQTRLSQRSSAFSKMASQFEQKASARSGVVPYAGGISIADRSRQIKQPDRVQPSFNTGMMDNFIPDGIMGNEDLNSKDD
jgi:hypothetical protein